MKEKHKIQNAPLLSKTRKLKSMTIWLDLNESILPCSALRSAYFVLMTAAHFSDNQILLWNILIEKCRVRKRTNFTCSLALVHIIGVENGPEHWLQS